MAASDRWADDIACRCGVVVTVHWVDRAYLTSEPEICGVVGPAIKRVHKSGRGFSSDHVDVLCGRCGGLLHESEFAKRFGPKRGGNTAPAVTRSFLASQASR